MFERTGKGSFKGREFQNVIKKPKTQKDQVLLFFL